MSGRLLLAFALVLSAVTAAVMAGERAGQGLAVGAALVVVLTTVAVQAQYELTHSQRGQPDPDQQSPVEKHAAEMYAASNREKLTRRAHRITHLQQVESYLEERHKARECGK